MRQRKEKSVLIIKTPKSCKECDYGWGITNSKTGIYSRFECKLLDLKKEDYNGLKVDEVYRGCPLHKMPLPDEVEAALDDLLIEINEKGLIIYLKSWMKPMYTMRILNNI